MGVRKKNIVLPNLKILKLKHNKLNIDEGYLLTTNLYIIIKTIEDTIKNYEY